jgi:hypothetical protein
MTPMPAGRFLRDNAFLVAAVALPIVVVAFFMIATAIPRWRVPPPAYDLLVRAASYDQSRPRVLVEFDVRDGRVEGTARTVPENTFPPAWKLFLFEHETMTAREIPVRLPEISEGDPPRTFVVEGLANRRVIDQTRAPDGYELTSTSSGSPGFVGELFGMRRYDRSASITNQGRVVSLRLPTPSQYYSPLTGLGWLANEEVR